MPELSFIVSFFCHIQLFFSPTFSFPGNVFCHDELLMSMVEGSVVSENKRVTQFLLFSSPKG